MPNLYRDPANPGRLALDLAFYGRLADPARRSRVLQHTIPPRSGWAWPVQAGQVCRLSTPEGAQVGDLNLWNLHNPRERFWASRTRQLQGAHVTTGARLWSCLPYLRPMVTLIADTLPTAPTPHGGRCHDLLGTRCDPYVYQLLDGRDLDVTCHNNLTRAVAPWHLTELDVHDVLNVFQVTGLDPVHGVYFMEASPAKRGDYLEFFAEQDLLCAFSACPSGDLSAWGWEPGSNVDRAWATCKPLGVEVYDVAPALLTGWRPPESPQVRPVGDAPVAG